MLITEEQILNIEVSVRVQAAQVVRATRQVQDYADICQDLYLAIFRKVSKFDPERACFKTFCCRVLDSAAKNLIRKFFTGKNQIIVNAVPIAEEY